MKLLFSFGLFFVIALQNFPASNGFLNLEEVLSANNLEDELRKQAEAVGAENELELLLEALDRYTHGEMEEFEASVNLAGHIGPHKPNPECYMNVSQLITSKGYGVEEHYPVTTDGFVLALQRIIPKSGVVSNSSTVVLLQHGLLDSASTWVINFEYDSLGFMLADQGFDVWLSNSRGNKYSHTNIHYKPSRRKFWEFSWDEMAGIDLPTFVNYITLHTKVPKIHYVGHSQGTLIGFTGFSQDKALADKIQHFYALAPITTMGHVAGPIRLLGKFHSVIYNFLNLIGYEEFLPNTPAEQLLARTLCSTSPITCELITFLIAGHDWAGYNRTRADVYYTHFPAGTSLQDINHWGQMIVTANTQMYDYGSRDNKKHYGQKTPPVYNVTGLSVPVSLFYGGNDPLADVRDVELLRQSISDTVVYDLYLDRFSHLDFVWGTTAYQYVYNVIIDQIKNGV